MGAPYEDIEVNPQNPGTEEHVGAIYIFHYSGTTWVEQAKLTASDGDEWDHFGSSVDITKDGDFIIVGAHQKCPTVGPPGSECGTGKAYLFSRSEDTWSEDTIFHGSGAVHGALFGCSVSIDGDGDTILIGAKYDGAPEANPPEEKRGEAYVFTNSPSGWSEVNIHATDWAETNIFGASVDLDESGEYAVIGAREGDCGSHDDEGAVYIFHLDGSWSEDAKLCSDYPWTQDWFGFDVAIDSDGNTVVVGSRKDDVGLRLDAGSVEVFRYNSTSGEWEQEARLTASNYYSNDQFGRSVSISSNGQKILAGASLTDISGIGFDVGTAYLYSYDPSNLTWSEDFDINADDMADEDWYGWSLSLSGDGNYCVVGAPQDDVGLYADTGSAYAVGLTSSVCP